MTDRLNVVCRYCGFPAYHGLNDYECSNPDCDHFFPQENEETDEDERTTDPGWPPWQDDFPPGMRVKIMGGWLIGEAAVVMNRTPDCLEVDHPVYGLVQLPDEEWVEELL